MKRSSGGAHASDQANEVWQSTKAEVLWHRRDNPYYHQWLVGIHSSVIRTNSNVLHVGCECGDLLAALCPADGVGVEMDPQAITLARRRFPSLTFCLRGQHRHHLERTYDYIVVSGRALGWRGDKTVIEDIRSAVHPGTRILITYYNSVWHGMLSRGLPTMRLSGSQHKWSISEITELLHQSHCEVIRSVSYLMVPKRIPVLSLLCNHFLSSLPGCRRLNLITIIVARPALTARFPGQVSVSVVVPCRNERGNIGGTVRRIPHIGRGTEIIFVDGNSTDGTTSEIERLIKKWPDRNIRLICQRDGVGKGDAVRRGFAVATGDVLVIQDADLTVPPEDLARFFRTWCDGKGDLIIGSRLTHPLERRAMRYLNLLGNRLFALLFSWSLGQRFTDTLCGTKMISRKHYELIAASRSHFGELDPFGDFDLILGAVKHNLKIVELQVQYRARTYGNTNISRFRHGWLLLKMSWLAFKRFRCVHGDSVEHAMMRNDVSVPEG